MNIVFVCTGNAARSVMAEALARALVPAQAPLRFFSAGTHPKGVHPETIAVLQEAGVETAGLASKSIDDVPYAEARVVITLCDSARDACPVPPPGARHIHWSLRDPADPAIPDQERRAAFRQTREEVLTCVKRLMFELAMDPSLRRRP